MNEHPNDHAHDHQADFPAVFEIGGCRATRVAPDDVTGWARWHVHDAEGVLVGIVGETHEWLGDRYADATFTAVWNPTLGPFEARWCAQGHADAHAALAALAAYITTAGTAATPTGPRVLRCRCDRGCCRQNVYAVVTDHTGEHVPVCASHLAGATVAIDGYLCVVEAFPLDWPVASVTQLAYELALCRRALRVATGRDAHDVAALVDTALTSLCAQAVAHAGRAGIGLAADADADEVSAVLGELTARDLAWAARLVDSARGGHVPGWLREIAADLAAGPTPERT